MNPFHAAFMQGLGYNNDNNNNNNYETGSRSPCMRPRSDPPKMKNSNVVRSRLIILINEEINESELDGKQQCKIRPQDQAAYSIWMVCE